MGNRQADLVKKLISLMKGKEEIPSPKKVTAKTLVVLGLIVVSFFISSFVFSKFAVSIGRSTPYHLFLKDFSKEPELYDYVLVKSPKEDPFAKGRIITKRVSCCCGKKLVISGLDYYCCEKERVWETCVYLGKAKTKSRKGIPVKPFNPCGESFCVVEIPAGKFFLVNDHPDSYDSRYLGLIDRNQILCVVKPVF